MIRTALAGILLCAAAVHGQVLDAVVARVDRSVITWSEVVQEVALRRLAGESNGAPEPRAVTEALVRRALLVAEARKMRLAAPPAEIQAAVKAVVDGAGGAAAFASWARQLGVRDDDVVRRAGEVVLMRRFLALRLEMTYVPEAEVRSFYSQQADVLGGRSLADVRDEVRSFLARKKYQQQLEEWIARQVAQGRVQVMEPPGGWPPLPAEH
ncbi:MAG: hypothetical protein HZB55_03975 [Deltaproteobacteria bacterium]|nr:hypothetical protein [Deltaproteobacteria bacterium]